MTAPALGCVDEATEALTATGWKTVHKLHVADEILTYNHAAGVTEWHPVQAVCTSPPQPRVMVHMQGRGHSSLTTPDHHWPVVTRSDRRKWKRTESLSHGDQIPVGAPCASLPQTAVCGDGFVEVIGWFWTEGHCLPSGGAEIYQSLKNAANVDRIDGALRTVFGPPREHDLGSRAPEPRWRRYTHRSRDTVIFALNASAGQQLQSVAPKRVVGWDFLRRLTKAQLDLFIEVSMLADNHGPTRLAQHKRVMSEPFQFAAILAGYPTSLIERTFKRDGYIMWMVTLQRRMSLAPVASLMAARSRPPGDGPGRWVIEPVRHGGLIWYPQTANLAWCARREGKCFFAGAPTLIGP